jgi:MSHA pilin protein MshA
MRKATQHGFTLIELVVVIVILGILAAFAVPRFMGLETEARVAAIKSMGGTLRSAASMGHGLCMSRGCSDLATNILVNGQNVTFTFQYPTNATVRTALDNVEGFATGGVLNRFTKSGARTPANCWVEYQAPTATNTRPVIAYPAGVIGVAGVTELAVDTALRASC